MAAPDPAPQLFKDSSCTGGGVHTGASTHDSQGMDSLGALADQTIAGAKHDRCGLRLLAFHGHEPHGGALSGLTDGLGIRSLSLLSLDERLPVRRRDQLHRVAEFIDLPAPV